MQKGTPIERARSMTNVVKVSSELFIGAMAAYDIVGLHELLIAENVSLNGHSKEVGKGLQCDPLMKNVIRYLANLLQQKTDISESLGKCLNLAFRQRSYLVYIFLIEILYSAGSFQKIGDALTQIIGSLSLGSSGENLHRYILMYKLEPKYIYDAFEASIRKATKDNHFEIIVNELRTYLKSYPNV